MKKVISYILVVLGLGILAIGVKPVNDEAVKSLPFLAQINGNYLMVAGIVVILIGVIVLRTFSGTGKQPSEVPIYHGKNVVGFRRMKK
jgi:multisubunit Na+/H+ antiporter MnhB subunit